MKKLAELGYEVSDATVEALSEVAALRAIQGATKPEIVSEILSVLGDDPEAMRVELVKRAAATCEAIEVIDTYLRTTHPPVNEGNKPS